MDKEELKRQLAAIEEKELKEFQEEHYSDFKRMIGRCFKSKNSFSRPASSSDYWNVYYKLISISRDDIHSCCDGQVMCRCRVMSFQKDKNSTITIHGNESLYVDMLEEEIPADEFNKKYEELLNELKSYNNDPLQNK